MKIVFSIKYHYSDILLKTFKLHLYHRLCCSNQTCYCVNMVSVTSVSRNIRSASRYHPRFQSRNSVYNRGLIPQNSAELAEAVPMGELHVCTSAYRIASSESIGGSTDYVFTRQ